MYIWKEPALLDKTGSAVADLVKFCREQKIETVFINAASIRQKRNDPQWESLLADLHGQGLKVEALIGDPSWLVPGSGIQAGMVHVAAIAAYQAVHRHSPAQRFDGLHFDVEMEGCPASENQRIEWFLQFIDSATRQRESAGLHEADLPFNWDMSMHSDQPGFAAMDTAYAGITKPGWQHILDRLERITFMAYSDRPRYISAGLQAELTYLHGLSNPPPCSFALEFQSRFRGKSLNSISLADEDYSTYRNLREYLSAMMATHSRPSFTGFALHHYDPLGRDDVKAWFAQQNLGAPAPLDFIADEDLPKLIPSNPSERITDPVYVKMNFLAHPDHEPQSVFQKGALSFLPIGYGYCDESRLVQLGGYDGLMPSDWFFYGGKNDARWWPSVWDDTWTDLNDNGLCWQNPASLKNDPRLGVERIIVLQRGRIYRLLLAYNDVQGIEQFVAREVRAEKQAGWGDTPDHPVEITMYLGRLANLSQSDAPHLNDCRVQVAQPNLLLANSR